MQINPEAIGQAVFDIAAGDGKRRLVTVRLAATGMDPDEVLDLLLAGVVAAGGTVQSTAVEERTQRTKRPRPAPAGG